jgi:hypothetical protein
MADVLSMASVVEPMEGEFSEAQAVLPLQFYGTRRGISRHEPLRRLMVAMLVDAIRCFQTMFVRRRPARLQEFTEARAWLFSDEDDGPFSFRAVCDELEIDAEVIRKWLGRWQRQKLGGRKPHVIRRSAFPAKRISV